MKITAINCKFENGSTRITISSDQYPDLYCAFDRKIPENNLGELALLVFLGQSMIDGSPLVIPEKYRICPQLLGRLETYQEIFHAWYPRQMQRISIVCSSKTPEDYGVPTLKGISLFSGGLDSIYTFIKKKEEVDTLLLCKGFDLKLSETRRIRETEEQCRNFAERFGVGLVTVETNLRDVIVPYATELLHGMLLVGISLALCPEKLFVPASHTYNELERWGSHPLTDPMLSTATTEVVHHGPARRSAKLAFLADGQQILDILRVCNASDEYNCGKCEKCIRTMFALKVVGKQSKALSDLSIKELKKVRIYNESAATFWRDNALLAMENGQGQLHGIANKIVKTYEIKKLLKQLMGFSVP